MLTVLSFRTARSVSALSLYSRRLATHAPALSASGVPVADASTSSSVVDRRKDGALRPHLGIEVNPNHGLYAFFRRKEKDGQVTYDTAEPVDIKSNKSGASMYVLDCRTCANALAFTVPTRVALA